MAVKRKLTQVIAATAAAIALLAFASIPAMAGTSITASPVHLEPGGKFQDCADCPDMVIIHPGEFLAGSEDGEADRPEGPVRKVVIGRALAVGRYEVTQAQFAAFVAATGHAAAAGCNLWIPAEQTVRRVAGRTWRDPGYGRPPAVDEPVVCVSWDDARAYAAWLAKATDRPYRLLTEAEWEFAARAGADTPFPWGTAPEMACRHGNVYDAGSLVPSLPWETLKCDDGYRQVSPVGRFAPNSFGLHDTVGNVWEWVEDCYAAPYPPTGPRDGSAQLVIGCDRRVSKGGSWRSIVSRQRPAFRGRDPADMASEIFGFRVARYLP